MKKSIFLQQCRDITSTELKNLSEFTGLSVDQILEIESMGKPIPHSIITFYAAKLKVRYSALHSLLYDTSQTSPVAEKLQSISLSILIAYFNITKRMESYGKKN